MLGFKAAMLRYFNAYDALHLEVMRSIAIGLNLDADFFTPVSKSLKILDTKIQKFRDDVKVSPVT